MGVHGMDAQTLLGNPFFIRLRTLRTVSCCMKSYPDSKINRFGFKPLALAARVSLLRGWQHISQTSSSLSALVSALPLKLLPELLLELLTELLPELPPELPPELQRALPP